MRNDQLVRLRRDPTAVRFQDTLLWLASPISRAITRRGAYRIKGPHERGKADDQFRGYRRRRHDDDVVGVDRGTRNHPTILWITVRPGFAMNRLVKWNRRR